MHLTVSEVALIAEAINDPTILRTVFGRPGRGLPKKFYALIANEYLTLIKTSEAPGQALALTHGVCPSSASRWLKEARKLGLL